MTYFNLFCFLLTYFVFFYKKYAITLKWNRGFFAVLKDRLLQAREKKGFTQTHLAELLGVTPGVVNRWEKGTRIPSRRIHEVAKLLNITYEWLTTEQADTTSKVHIPGVSLINTHDISNKIIAYQGRPAAYSHLACKNRFPQFQPKDYASFEDCFAAVESDEAGLAMIPIENSLGGRVADIHLILPNSGLYIIGEHFQPVQHMLWGLPNASLSGIKKIMSHEQALSQCRSTILALNAEPVIFSDTAGACEYIANKKDKSLAALASSLAGETYGLQSLRERVEDKLGNVTRFIVMSRRSIIPDNVEGARIITSFIFTVRSIPAALYKCMGGFATNSVNFIKLESYISIADHDNASFYAEIEGHPSDKAVERAFDELNYFTTKVKILGTFPADSKR